LDKDFSDLPELWKVLIVDDDEDIISLSHVAIKDIKFLNIGLRILTATTEEEGFALLEQHPDIALLLTDLEMDSVDSGFRLVQYVRQKLNNSTMRVIVRTGQKNDESILTIVEQYDINDYFKKAEVDIQRLKVIVYTALRGYKALFDSAIAVKRWNNEYLEKKRQMEVFSEFVPESLCPSGPKVSLHEMLGVSQQEEFGVLFCDIRNFTTFAEKISSRHCFNFLNSYFSTISPEIENYGGFVYQLLGDGVLAMYPKSEGMSGKNLLLSAINIQDCMHIYNRGRKRAGYENIKVGIGLNMGDVAIGISGTKNNMSATAFGATVNLASRCDMLSKMLNIDIVATEHVVKGIDNLDGFLLRNLGKVRVKGLTEMTAIYEVFNSDTSALRDEKLAVSRKLGEVFDLIENTKIKSAKKILKECSRKYKRDPLPEAILELLKDPNCIYFPKQEIVKPKKMELWPFFMRSFSMHQEKTSKGIV
jgi:class 3 adenylate cyclase